MQEDGFQSRCEARAPDENMHNITGAYHEVIGAEIGITRFGEPKDPIVIHTPGENMSAVKDNMDELLLSCKSRVEEGNTREEIIKWLDSLERED